MYERRGKIEGDEMILGWELFARLFKQNTSRIMWNEVFNYFGIERKISEQFTKNLNEDFEVFNWIQYQVDNFLRVHNKEDFSQKEKIWDKLQNFDEMEEDWNHEQIDLARIKFLKENNAKLEQIIRNTKLTTAAPKFEIEMMTHHEETIEEIEIDEKMLNEIEKEKIRLYNEKLEEKERIEKEIKEKCRELLKKFERKECSWYKEEIKEKNAENPDPIQRKMMVQNTKNSSIQKKSVQGIMMVQDPKVNVTQLTYIGQRMLSNGNSKRRSYFNMNQPGNDGCDDQKINRLKNPGKVKRKIKGCWIKWRVKWKFKRKPYLENMVEVEKRNISKYLMWTLKESKPLVIIFG